MLFSNLRRQAWVHVVATMLVAIVGGAALNWGHLGGDDPDCDLTFAVPGYSSPHVAATPTTPPHDHCPICHSLRLLQLAISGQSLTASGIYQVVGCSPKDTPAPGSVFVLNGSPRAPPVAHL